MVDARHVGAGEPEIEYEAIHCHAVIITAALSSAATQMTTAGVPAGAEGWYLPTADRSGELFIYEIGAGDPVVVLHGGPGADFSYPLPVARGLERQFRFVFYDQRGSLRSRVTTENISMARHVKDLETLREALGAQRIRIVSHSAGTLLAFQYLRAHGDRVRELVMDGALPHKNGERYFDAEYAATWTNLADDARRFAEREAVAVELGKARLQANLEPRRMAGEMSEGMLFDIGYADGLVPALAVPERRVPNGVRAG